VASNADEKEWEQEFEHIPYQYSMSSYGADYTVDMLVKRMAAGDIYVPPFQRGFVWSYIQASRFVESLLLGLPVPGIFLSREYNTQKLLVIDGQQRLSTLQFFYDGIFQPTGRQFTLKGVQPEFEGATYKTLKPEDRRRLDDSVIHATIVKQDKPEEDNSGIYYIFERLNTGGTLLLPQEIRSSIFQGEFDNLLKELNQNPTWRSIFGRVSSHMRDQELILRFFALRFYCDRYSRPMKIFLNKYMGMNRHLKYQSREELTRIFVSTMETAAKSIGTNAFKLEKVITASILDSVAVGISCRLERGDITDHVELARRYQELLKNEHFLNAVTVSTADEKNVRLRIEMATKVFADVK